MSARSFLSLNHMFSITSPPVSCKLLLDFMLNLKSRKSLCQWFYLVDWRGFGPDKRSWKPPENIIAPAFICKFYLLRKHRKRGLKGGNTVKNCSPTTMLCLSANPKSSLLLTASAAISWFFIAAPSILLWLGIPSVH